MAALRITRRVAAAPQAVVRRLGEHFADHDFVHLEEVGEHGFTLVLRPSVRAPAVRATAVVEADGEGARLRIEHRGSRVSGLKVGAYVVLGVIMLLGSVIQRDHGDLVFMELPRGSFVLALAIAALVWRVVRREREARAAREFAAITGAVDGALAASASPYR